MASFDRYETTVQAYIYTQTDAGIDYGAYYVAKDLESRARRIRSAKANKITLQPRRNLLNEQHLTLQKVRYLPKVEQSSIPMRAEKVLNISEDECSQTAL